jgi:catalase
MPATFIAKFAAAKPDPATGKPMPEKIHAFNATHPDAASQTMFLTERLRHGPVKWDMLVAIGEPGDSETDPTVLWPKERKEINVGTLTLTSAAPPETAASNRINFDPLVMADGILPTDDPILLFRSPSYAYSYARRQSEG